MTALILDKPIRILLVDDDQQLNELLCEFLRSKGFLAYSAFSFAEAKCKLSTDHEIDLVLLDYELGDGNGLQLMRTLTVESAYAVPPIIMISVNEDPEFLEDCFSCGIADYIIKPINLSLLALKVKAFINAVSMQQVIKSQNSELARFKQEAEREEAVAKFIYEYLLGQNSQSIEGVNIWLKPSSAFSGDLAITCIAPGGDLYFMLADATGHGLSAAITIIPAVSIFTSMVTKGFHIKSIVAELNKKINRDTPSDRFVAAIVVQVQKDQHRLDIWNGGMPTAYWVSDGVVQQKFRSRHMALGILGENQFDAEVETYCFSSRGFLFACTDGLLEERNSAGECFSRRKVVDIIQSNPVDLHQQLISALHTHAGHETYSDDISICTLTPSKMLFGN